MTVTVLAGCNTYTNDDSKTEEASGGEETSATGETAEDTIRVAGGIALTFNQFASQATNDQDAMYLVMSALVRYYDGAVENDATASYTVSEDGKTYTFTLRDGLTYSDGTAISAEDFAYAMLKYIGPDTGAADYTNYLGIQGAEAYNAGEGSADEVGIKALDESTLEITLAEADSAFITKLALYPVYPVTQEFYEKCGETYGTTPESTLYSGPYTLTEYTVETSMTFEKNDNWWNAEDEFPMKTIMVYQIDSANTKVSMFENGELDILSKVDTNYVSTISDYVDTYESNNEMFLWMKEGGATEETAEVMSNANFRKALTYALDREAIGSAVSSGFVGTNRAVSSNYPGTTGKYIEDYTIDTAPIQGDVTLAKEYLSKALEELGYSDVSELPQMTYISFERDDMKLLGETIVDTWKQVLGITSIQFAQYPIATAIQRFYTGEYDFFMISLGCSVTPLDIIRSFTPDGDYGFFTEGWTTDISTLLEDAESEDFQSVAYYEKVAKVEEALLNEYAFVPLYNETCMDWRWKIFWGQNTGCLQI